ncbi:hypothetical protein KSX_41720 [Ktedonospora formicarum]|uniref:Uncharacterized protein n=1 Tax=Ktedonospora formicarum TaxID=2778364 RepID=A0A8J3I604_9CHLR|nr:hypothetical protein KSX_41720 [Ktedonospora formicarum]
MGEYIKSEGYVKRADAKGSRESGEFLVLTGPASMFCAMSYTANKSLALITSI